MLVLRRKTHETILIGGTTKIKVLAINKGVVDIGIEAPPEVRVVRGERFQPSQGQPSSDSTLDHSTQQ